MKRESYGFSWMTESFVFFWGKFNDLGCLIILGIPLGVYLCDD